MTAQLTPVEKVTEALGAYYRQADGFLLTRQEQLAWYSSLTPEAKIDALVLGPFYWGLLPAFRRYALEKRDYCLLAFMSVYLTADELASTRPAGIE